ncbi:MAG: protein kinase [Bacteroidetes Order II. Incertae sedis bacterium]|nr:protein kinase [Bacteroidetes Order II. bacterium]MBT5250890.1 protein kinase [Bacteroidetes Order II. bacterium]
MTSSNWQLLEDWFERLDTLEPEAREEELNRLSESDPDLVNHLRRLFNQQAEPFFEKLNASLVGSWDESQAPSSAPCKPGDLINQFLILGELGRGGMGIVYRARDTTLERDVALKFLPVQLSKRPTSQARLLSEARVISHLDHPNLPTIYDVGEHALGRFIIMQVYEGTTLQERLDLGDYDEALARNILIQCASGLAAAHSKSVVHQDIKPANIFVKNDGTIVILDFGIAQAMENETISAATLGTLAYMSPEQVCGKAIGKATDVWSLGAVVYQTLLGKRPLEATSVEEMISLLKQDDLLIEYPSNLDPRLRTILSQCLQKESTERLQSGGEVRVAITKAGLTNPGSTGSPARTAFAVSMVAVLILAVMSVLWWQSFRTKEAPAPLSVLVQPFGTLTSNDFDPQIASGMSSDILARLGELRGLRLIRGLELPTEVSARYADSLNADYVVSGDIQRSENELRVFARLYDVADGSLRWSGSFDRSLDHPLALQSEVAAAIAAQLTVEFSAEEFGQLERGGSRIPDAQDAYLLGMAHVLRRTPSELSAASASFLKATQLDANYAEAWAGFAYARMLQAGTAYSPEQGSRAYEEARSAAKHALTLDPRQALASTTLASIYSEFDWDTERADSAFIAAIDLNPNSAEAHHLFASHLSESGRLERALDQQRLAGLLDPESLIHPTNLALIHFYNRENRDALQLYDEVLDKDSSFYMAHLNRSFLTLAMGQPEASLNSLAAAERLVGPRPVVRALRASAFAQAGDTEQAERILDSLLQESESRYVSAPLFSQVYISLGDTSRALDYLNQGLLERDVYMTVMRPWPLLDVLRDNPRFQRILSTMGPR